MKQTIEDLWYGNVNPCEICGTSNEEMKELTRLMVRNEQDLKKELNDRQKAMLEKYTDCADEYWNRLLAQAFHDGFSLASKLLTEALG